MAAIAIAIRDIVFIGASWLDAWLGPSPRPFGVETSQATPVIIEYFRLRVCALAHQPARNAGSARPVVLVVFALAVTHAQRRIHRRTRAIQLRVRVERRLVGPPFQQYHVVAVRSALEDVELFAAGLLPALRRALLERFRKLGALPRRGRESHYQSNRHRRLLLSA